MRLFILTLSIFSVIIPATAQESDGWVVYSTSADILISYKQADCVTNDAPSQIAYIIKVENRSNHTVQVEWDLSVWYNYEKLAHDIADGEDHMVVQVAPNKEVQGVCENPFGPLYIFKDFITYVSPTKLTRFELENITITNL